MVSEVLQQCEDHWGIILFLTMCLSTIFSSMRQ